MKIWTIYILRCGDGTLYTGISDDVPARLLKHEQGLGAKYTKGRGPLELIYTEEAISRSEALKREHAIKQLNREDKLNLLK